jgi:Zn-dependent protease with chaperone function
MNFFEQQESARKKSTLLVVVYVLTVAMIIGLIYVTVLLLFSFDAPDGLYENAQARSAFTFWNPKLLFVVVMSTLIIIGGGTIVKIYSLSGGGKSVAESLGGVLVTSNTRDFLERRLLNVVEEMAIASGTPVPEVYLLPSENGINAFAAGTRIDNAVIGVTRGCLNILSREELQGVVAHEFSHILNGDMRLNLKLIGVLSGLLILSQIGYLAFRMSGHRRMGRGRGGDNKAQVAIVILGLVVMVLGYIGVFFSRIIKSAVSRQREFLADASAVQFTRYPGGISGALKKIGSLQHGSQLVAEKAEEASHMFFSSGLSFSFLFATHPPLKLRIKKIEPSFNGTFVPLKEAEVSRENASQAEVEIKEKKKGGVLLPGMDAVRDAMGGAAFMSAALAGGSEVVLDSIGSPDESHLAFATALRKSIPDHIIEAAHEPVDAQALVLVLLIVSSKGHERTQLELLSSLVSQEVYDSALTLLSELKPLGVSYRLPLVELCIPALKNLSKEQNKEFMKVVYAIIASDDSVSLFEYVLSRILANRMQDRKKREGDGFFSKTKSLQEYERECHRLLAVVARFGTDDHILQEVAFAAGGKDLALSANLSIQSIPSVSFRDLDAIIETLYQTSLKDREKIVRACYHVIWADSEVTLEEAEVFRAISDSLEIPVPPILPQ